MQSSPVGYARTRDGTHLAYAVQGDGPVDLVEVGNGTNMSIEAAADEPRWDRFVGRLESFARLVRFDARGIGLSDPLAGPASIEQWANDTVADMDAVRCTEAGLMATGHSGPVALFVAATQPSRVRAVVLINSYARLLRAPDYPHGLPAEIFGPFVDALVEPAGGDRTDDAVVDDLVLMAPSRVGDPAFRAWWQQWGHRGASPATARAMHVLAGESDVRDLLARVQCPVLVVHSADNRYVRVAQGRYLAARLPQAKLVEVDSGDHLAWNDDVDVAGEIEEFLTGTRQAAPTNRRLATVLFTDIVGSTQTAGQLGDGRWREQLDRHDLVTRRQIERSNGRFIKSTGDGVLATFDGPARAILCARSIRDALAQIGITIRAGIHVGEIEDRGNDISGITVHTAERICSTAGAGEILTSRTVADLATGSDIVLTDHGEHELKGIPGTWQLFVATD
jgi:class 3 adenylate cyclase